MNLKFLFLCAVVGCAVLLATSSSAAAPEAPTSGPERVVLIGDSTVASGSGWGDAFAKLLAPGVECRNLAIKGRSSKSYRDEGHWQKVLEAKPTWVLIQFGHNDQPGKGPKLETDAKSTFRENLARYIADVRAIGARPVLVTSLTRRNFNVQGKIVPGRLEARAAGRWGRSSLGSHLSGLAGRSAPIPSPWRNKQGNLPRHPMGPLPSMAGAGECWGLGLA